MRADRSLKTFKVINLLFWAIWVAIPFCIAASTDFWDKAIVFSGIESGCTEAATKELSDAGKTAAFLFFVFDTLVYLILFGLMHIMVRDCAKGRLFINRSISIMGYIAAVVFVWPFLTLITFNLARYYLVTTGDLPIFKAEYQLEPIMIGAGLFFFVLRLVLQHALKMHEDAKLTV
jgi:hypothetical protein